MQAINSGRGVRLGHGRQQVLTILVATCTTMGGCASVHRPESVQAEWVATWQAPPQLTEPRNLPPAPGLSGTTLRQRFHLTLGGTSVRVRLSNEYGDGALEVARGFIAPSAGRDAQEASAGAAMLFGGLPSVVVPAGAFVWSDDIALHTNDQADVAVSLYFTRVPAGVTGHPGSRTASYIAAGNHAGDATLTGAVRTEHWYFASNLEVLRQTRSAVVAVLGNSIADGRGSGTERNNRWPDNLARRLSASSETRDIAVSNAGIGGNAVLRGGLGPTALARFDRDILGQRGVRWVIVSEGVNDIGGARGADSSASVGHQLIQAYQAFIARAHARGVRVYGATILPFGGSQYDSPEHERARAAVNRWVRESGAFDAVIDLDAAMRDPLRPEALRHELDSGDHLHPNEPGYVVMANAIDLHLFSTGK